MCTATVVIRRELFDWDTCGLGTSPVVPRCDRVSDRRTQRAALARRVAMLVPAGRGLVPTAPDGWRVRRIRALDGK